MDACHITTETSFRLFPLSINLCPYALRPERNWNLIPICSSTGLFKVQKTYWE
ncbi:MAG: hypothetical protein IJV90_03710 [Candidatus Methanomethylophilaceae archaeon]|nr:hypothetical protein [Candidatus Methanomethylophilaceae archaeon]